MLHRLALWSVAAGLPLLVLANWLYGPHLYALGVKIILHLQRYSSPPLDAFFIFFTFIIDPLFVTACIVLMLLVMRRKLLAYTTVLFILFNSYLTTVLKAFFAAPRPYWTSHAVRNIGYYCPKDFGNPSGHAEFAAVVGCVILLEMVDTKRQKVFAVLAVVLMGAVSTSRLYLGGHSLDQVMLGLYMGVALSLLYSHGGLRQLIQKQLVGRNSRSSLIVAGLVVMYVLTLAGYWINQSKQKSHRVEAKIWMANYKQKCGKTIDEQYLNVMMAALSSVVTSTCAGLIFGMRSLSAQPNFVYYASGLWKMNAGKYNAVVRYIFFYAIEGVLFLGGLLVFSPLPLLLGQEKTVMLVFANLGALVGTYLMSAYSFRVQLACGLVEVEKTLARAKQS